MKQWLTAQEIADERLPQLPATKRGVNLFAARHNWQAKGERARPRPGSEGGGGREYHVDLLPACARLSYLRRHVTVDVPAAAQGTTVAGPVSNEADARLAIVEHAERFRAGSGLSTLASDRLFATLYNSDGITVSLWIRQTVKRISPRTLARWRAAVRSGSADALAVDRGAARKGTGVLDRAEDGAVRALVLAALSKNPLLTTKHLRALVRDRYGETLAIGADRRASLPPLRTFQRQVNLWRHQYRHELTALTDPDRFKSAVRFVATGSTVVDRLNEVWQIDASPADVMTRDGRLSVYVAVDVWSRRMTLLVTATARAEAVGLLVRKCLLAWGVPERIKSDNGADFTARWTSRLLASLGIEHETAAPFSPEQKGIVERAIGTFQRDCARTLPGFVGHNVADRKRIEAKTAFARRLGAGEEALFGVDLTAAELAEHADAWAETVYAHAPHAGLKGATPFARAASWSGPVRRIEDPAALDILLARVPGRDGIRRVTRSGIRIDGTHYLIGTVMPGEDVLCRMDPADLGRLHVFTPDGETFLGHAVAPELAGLDPAATIARVRAEQKAFIDGRLAPIRRAARQIGPRDIAGAIRREAEDRSGTLVAFQRPGEIHDTPTIAAARQAAAGAPEPVALEGRAAELHAAMQRESASKPTNVTPLRTEETMQQRFRRALDLQGRIDRGEPVNPADAVWLGGYQAGPEYRAMSGIYEDYGEAALR